MPVRVPRPACVLRGCGGTLPRFAVHSIISQIRCIDARWRLPEAPFIRCADCTGRGRAGSTEGGGQGPRAGPTCCTVFIISTLSCSCSASPIFLTSSFPSTTYSSIISFPKSMSYSKNCIISFSSFGRSSCAAGRDDGEGTFACGAPAGAHLGEGIAAVPGSGGGEVLHVDHA